jgi:hypothetical protein
MTYPDPPDYSGFSTDKLEEMLQQNMRPEERFAIFQELDRRLTNRNRAASFSARDPRQQSADPSYVGGPYASFPLSSPSRTSYNPTPSRQYYSSISWLAVVALVLSILVGPGSVAAIVVGLIALRQIKARHQTGRLFAAAGVVIGSAGIILILLLLLIDVLASVGGQY